ncbi:hypothetical protein ACFYOT_39340 [Saccharothrix saharensis]|uniref:hypothetical protein n=1 Tax=Saccharothrix saharensis TaxID=571190 RepID=UPI00367CA6DA
MTDKHSELPPELRTATESLAFVVHQGALAHAQLRHLNAAHLVRRVLADAARVVVDAHDWHTDTGGLVLREVHDSAGRALWREGQTASVSSPRRRRARDADRRRWSGLVVEIQRELTAAVDYVSPSECGWEQHERWNPIERLYAVPLPTSSNTTGEGGQEQAR